MPFRYPEVSHVRRHGPQGYAEYESYRPWLRDEFTFRCVYCLNRERWNLKKGAYAIDHFHPQLLQPNLTTDYDDLLYACIRCNLTKADQIAPDPTIHLIAQHVRVLPDGALEGSSPKAEEIIRKLDLNSPQTVEWRLSWMRVIELAREYDRGLFVRLMGFPDDLPNLGRLRPPMGNSRPDGIHQSWYARQQRGELPESY